MQRAFKEIEEHVFVVNLRLNADRDLFEVVQHSDDFVPMSADRFRSAAITDQISHLAYRGVQDRIEVIAFDHCDGPRASVLRAELPDLKISNERERERSEGNDARKNSC